MLRLLLASFAIALLILVFQLGRWTQDSQPSSDEERAQTDNLGTPVPTPSVPTETETPSSGTGPGGTEPPPAVDFHWTFDGTPQEPQPFQDHPDHLDFDVQVHSRNQPSWGDDALPAEDYDHGADCSGAPDWRTFPQHTNTSYENAVFICNNHLMSANAGSGYGAVALTPNRLIDLSQGTAKVSLRMSTFRHSDRDWVEFTFSPWDGNSVIPCQFCPDLQGNPVQSLMLNMSQEKLPDGRQGTGFALYVNGQLVNGICPCYETVLEPDKARRDLVEIEVSDTHLIMRMPEYDLTLVDATFASLGWDKTIFQIIHHSYDPEKGSPMHGDKAGPNTWHWDDIAISPSTPFEIVKAEARALLRDGPGDMGSMTFGQPAPENAYLRFAAFANPDVSFDGGATWVRAEPQPTTRKQVATDSYFIPVPAGTQQVDFKANCVTWYCEEMHVKDVAIWAQPESQVQAQTSKPQLDTQPLTPPATGTAGILPFVCSFGTGAEAAAP